MSKTLEAREQLAPMIPNPAQQEAINRMAGALWETGGALNAAEMGFGKTLVAIETMLNLGAQTVLISAPLHVRYSWEDTIERQTNYAIPFRWINNSNKAGKEALESLKRGDAGFYFIGRELFRLSDWRGVFIDGVIHDECATLASLQSGGKKTRSRGYDVAFDLRHRTKYTIAQSATWFGSSFERAWSIGRILWPDTVERNFYRWTMEFAKSEYDPFTPNQRKIVGEKHPGAFANSLPCYVNPPASTNLDKPVLEDIFVDLSRSQRKLYDDFEEKGVVWLKEHPMVADVPIVQRIRLRQLTLAECDLAEAGRLDDNGNPVMQVIFRPNAKSSKFDALKELLADIPDEKVVIATDSAKYARMVAARLGSDAFAWTGEATQKEREAAKGKFTKGSLKYIVAVQKAIADGTDGLQAACHILVVMSEDDSPVMNSQLIGRLRRQGQEHRVLVYRIRARDTLDDPQAATLLAKERSMRASMIKEEDVVAA